MLSPETPPEHRPQSGPLRRVLGAVALTLVLFGVLRYTVFSAVTAALVASGGTVVVMAGASMSETVETIFSAVTEFILGIFSAIADFVSSIFD